MSVDYQFFQEGLRDKFEHMAEVFKGITQEEEKDHTYEILAVLPVLLNSKLSAEQRSLAFKEYTEMKGHLRDSYLAQITRKELYDFAAQRAAYESNWAEEKRARSAALFQTLKEFLGEAEQEALGGIETDYELFKSQLSLIVKSSLKIPEDRVVGPKEVLKYIEKQLTNNL